MASEKAAINPAPKSSLFNSARSGVSRSGVQNGGAAVSGFRLVRLSLIDTPTLRQPRGSMDPAKLESLKDDISAQREQGNGIEGTGFLQAITLGENPEAPGRYVLMFGERRFRAAQALEVETIPAYITPAKHDPLNTFLQALSENEEREEISPMDEANAYLRLKLEFNLSTAEIARLRKKSASTVGEILKRNEYASDLVEALEANPLATRAARDIHSKIPQGDLRRQLIERIKAGAPYAEIDQKITEFQQRQKAEKLAREAETRSQRELQEHAANRPSSGALDKTPPDEPTSRSVQLGAPAAPDEKKLPRRPFNELARELDHATSELWDVASSTPPQGKNRREVVEAIKRAHKQLKNLALVVGLELE